MRIFLPIETKVRELDGKILLAHKLAQKGHTVVIGPKRELNEVALAYRPDVYFGDSAVARENKIRLYSNLNKVGTKVIILDTEGGLFISEDLFRKRLAKEVMDSVSKYFSWGPKVKSIIGNQGTFNLDKVVVTGNPKFDLTQEKFEDYYVSEANKLRQRFGKYLLINTNFSRANHFDNEILYKTSLSDLTDGRMEYGVEMLDHFVKMIRKLALKFADRTIIIRPHPSENHEFYREKYKDLKNVKVIHEGDVYPWILGSELLIHNSCTTGIEGVLLNKPVLAFRPIKNDDFDLELPNAVSEQFDSLKALFSRIELGDLGSKNVREAGRAVMMDYINNVNEDACDIIVEELSKATEREGDRSNFGALKISIQQNLRETKRYIFPAESTGLTYDLQKFPKLDRIEVKDIVGKIVSIIGGKRVVVRRFLTFRNSYFLRG